MREHQIVITLKPDQFLEVQRLARSAKAKSMGIFVRQKLLAALGIEGTLETTTMTRRAPELDNAVADLRRVHRELKEFVAESLSRFGDSTGEPEGEIKAQRPENTPPEPGDEIEDMARSTFAISPRLGVIEPWRRPGSEDQPVEEEAVRDPLAELLAEQGISLDNLVAQADAASAAEDSASADAEAGEDDDSFNVPRSLQERRRQLETAAKETVPEPESVTVAEEYGTSEDSSSQDSDDDGKNQQGGGQVSLGNPPFSGGPPPRKRQV